MSDTVNLDLNEISHRRVVEVLRAAGLHLIADQYEAQLPKPTPTEPKGDVLVRDHLQAVWIRHEDGVWYGRPGTTNWWTLSRRDHVVYRSVPQQEAIEALVQEFARNLENDLLDIPADRRLREFARRLLGGDQ